MKQVSLNAVMQGLSGRSGGIGVALFWLVFGIVALLSLPSFAQVTASCTTQLGTLSAGDQGIISAVMSVIDQLLRDTGESLYEGVINNSDFIGARNAVLVLAIAIYGVMIIFGMANFKPGEIISLLFKIALIVTLTSGGGWSFFSNTIARFFYGTMNEMVGIFMGVAATAATGTGTGIGNISQPLGLLNMPLATVVSAKFFIMLVGSFFTGPYGPILTILLVWGAFNFMMALFGALFTYVKSVVGLWFLFGLSPIFFLCLLFRRTANLFEGWINMALSFALQVILLFAFLSFFIVIITTSLDSMTNSIDWCWMDIPSASSGLPFDLQGWRAVKVDGVDLEGTGFWGLFGYIDQARTSGIVHPLDLMDILFFLLSSYIAWQYSIFVPQIASELSSGGLRITANADSMRNFFSARGMTPGQVGTKAIGGTSRFFR